MSARVDVLVLGAGGAGLSAAIESHDAGAETMILEWGESRDSVLTSSSGLGGRLFAFAGTDLQESLGIKDSAEMLYNDLILLGEGANDPALVKKYVDNQLDTYHWLKKLGAKFVGVYAASGMSVARAHLISEPVVNILLKACDERKIKILFNSRAERLLKDSNNRVIGARTVDGRLFKAKAVIIATGGFTHNKEMLKECVPALADGSVVPSVACVRHRGDGILMALEMGAGLKNMPWIAPTFGLGFQYSEDQPEAVALHTRRIMSIAYYFGAIIVNKLGKRFVNESWPYKDIGMEVLKQPDKMAYIIFDSKVRDKLNIPEFDGTYFPLIKPYCIEADSIRDLAIRTGLDPASLEETSSKYNRYVESGKDEEWGRTTLAGGVGKPLKIENPPFYSFRARPALFGSYAGLTVDADMHVLNVFGEQIDGLYAAGEVIGGFHGKHYHTGTAIGKAIIFGRIAGRNAAIEHK